MELPNRDSCGQNEIAMYSFLVAPRNNPLLFVVSACKGKKLRSQAVKPGHLQTLRLWGGISKLPVFWMGSYGIRNPQVAK